MKRILFVDDEANVLLGLERMLRPMRREWDMVFVANGQSALNLMARQAPFDVLVTDMRMPAMDGAELLKQVMLRYPETVRFVLSGQCDNETILRSAGVAHQFMAKPCDPEVLRNLVARACALRDLLDSTPLKQLVSGLDSLPSLPDLYSRVTEELESPDTSAKQIAELIERDVGMSAKILRFVNSAFFGLGREIADLAQAISLIGLEPLRCLILVAGLFSQVDTTKLPRLFFADALTTHSLSVGACARAIAKYEKLDTKMADQTFMAGLLHDSGKLVLAANTPTQYGQVLARVEREGVALLEAEAEEFGAVHSDVGAYLLGLWGLPAPIVKAVAFHPWPRRSIGSPLDPLTMVHVANCFDHEQTDPEGSDSVSKVDLDYLTELGLENSLPHWRVCCQGQ